MHMSRTLALIGCLMLAPLSPPTWAEPAPLSDREKAAHALSRLGFGAQPGEVEAVMAEGVDAWIARQLDPASIDDSQVDAQVLQRFPSMGMTMTEVFATYRPPYPRDRRETPEESRRRNELRNQVRRELQSAVLHRALYSQRRFEEVILEFWRNHFSVDQSKDDVGFLANHYEQTLRRHAFGDFDDLLLATARHPAMLIFLDNAVSQKPLTEREQRLVERYEGRENRPRSFEALARHRGLNENYARELMELHTLGVDNGYTQRDVTELSRVLTGWSVGWTGAGEDEYGNRQHGEYGFVFRADVHDDRAKRVLGATLRGGAGEAEGVAVIRRLARDRRTAEFISWKLCRYLVHDDPPQTLVKRVARVFRTSRGDLPKVYAAIVTSPEFFDRANVGVKFKTPFEYVVSALRATDAQVEDDQAVLWSLRRMGQPVYQCFDPTGYYDQAEAWLDPGVLVYRWQFALALAGGRLEGVKLPEAWITSLPVGDDLADELVRQLVAAPVDPAATALLEEQIGQAFNRRVAVGVVLGSPMFQQQ